MLLAVLGGVVTEASCCEAEALVVSEAFVVRLLLAGAAPALVAGRTFAGWFVCPCLVGTTRTEGAKENHDGAKGLPP